MEIKTEQDMNDFCNRSETQGIALLRLKDLLSTCNVKAWEKKNADMIGNGKIGPNSHLQQGILWISHDLINREHYISIVESPFLYPSGKILVEHPDLTGPITGVLVNCYDPDSRNFLFHMRGTNIAAPFGFQAAAAGMGKFREHPQITAKRELEEEAGIEYPGQLFEGRATDCLPFMKSGKIPQLLFSFGFASDLSRFPVCRSLDEIAEFEERTKKGLGDGTLDKKEAYHFTIPDETVEDVAGRLNDSKRFYGPIYESTMNFIRTLRDRF